MLITGAGWGVAGLESEEKNVNLHLSLSQYEK